MSGLSSRNWTGGAESLSAEPAATANGTVTMHIGPYRLPNNLVLAPMAGVTDLPFRQLCRRHGAGLAVSEMVSSNALLWGSEKTRRRIDHGGEPEPRSVQIMGADPVLMAEAARYNADQGAQIIDINMGCPARKVCNVAAGSALLRDEPLVARILEAVVAAVDVPVTLKIRTGWDHDNRNGTRIARLAQACGIQAVAVHGRTRADGYRGEAEYDTIRAIKARVSIPVIANGDIRTPQRAREVLEHTGADAIMIGRAAQGRPWIFREVAHYLATGQELPAPPAAEVHALVREHLEAIYAFYGERTGLLMARKHVSWYTRGLAGGAAFREWFNRLAGIEEQRTHIESFFGELELKRTRSMAA